jgi:hypothetical protein
MWHSSKVTLSLQRFPFELMTTSKAAIEGNLGTHGNSRRSLLWMVLVGLAIRLVVVGFLYPERLNPERDHWRFAGETGRIAQSIVEGRGFSSPFFGSTGPCRRFIRRYWQLCSGCLGLIRGLLRW